jgi:hypothetical protein
MGQGNVNEMPGTGQERLAQDRLKAEREAQFAILAAAITAAVRAAMERWMDAVSPAPRGALDLTTLQAEQAAGSAGTFPLEALSDNRLAYRVSEIQQMLGTKSNLAYDLIRTGKAPQRAGRQVPVSAQERPGRIPGGRLVVCENRPKP